MSDTSLIMMSFVANQHKTFISLHVHSQLKTLNMSQKIIYAFLVTLQQEIYTNVWQLYIYISSAKHIYAHSDWMDQSMATYSGNPHRETTTIRRLIDNMKKKKHCFPTTELFELNICRNLWMTLKILNSDPIINCLQSDSSLYTLFVSFGKKETLNIGYQDI